MATASGQFMGTIWLGNGSAAPNSLVPYVDYEITTNVQNNTSQVKLTPWILKKNSKYTFKTDIEGTVSLGGQSYSISGFYDNTNETHTYLTGGTLTLPHNADGTLTASLSVTFRTFIDGTYLMKRGEVTGTIQFPTIPRESRVTSGASFTLGNSLSVSIQRYSPNFTHTLSLQVGGSVIKTVSGVGTSTTISLTSAEVDIICRLAAEKNSASLPVVLKCTTYSGSTAIGSVTQVNGTCTIPLGQVNGNVSCTLGKDLTVQLSSGSLFSYEAGVYWNDTLLLSQTTSGGDVTFSFTADNLAFLGLKAQNGQVPLTVRVTSKRGSLTVGTTSRTGVAQQKLGSIQGNVQMIVEDAFPYAVQPSEEGFQYRLVWMVDGVGVLTKDLDSLEGTFTFSPEENGKFYERLPDNGQHTLTLRCVTLAKGADVGHVEKSGTIQVDPQRAAPTAPIFTYMDIRSETCALTGNNQILVQGQSTLKVTILPENRSTSSSAATIQRYVLYCGDLVKGEVPFQENQTVEIVSEAPNSAELYVTAVDSRGNESAKRMGERGHITAQWAAYQPVQSGVPVLTRKNGIETQVSMDWKGYCWQGSFGQLANQLLTTYRFRSTLQDSQWTEKTMTCVWKQDGSLLFEERAQGTPPSKFLAGDLEGSGGFDASKSFLLTVTVEDCLTKATSVQGEIPTGIPPFYLDRGGIGVNKIRQQGAVDVDGAVHTTAGFFKEGEECLYPSTLEPLVRELTSNKLEKVSPSISGNFPALGTDGTLVDSGIPARLPTAAEVGAVSDEAPVWIYPTLSSGSYPSSQTAFRPRYAKHGHVVSIEGMLDSWTNGSSLFTIPEGYHPKDNVVTCVYAAPSWGTGTPTPYKLGIAGTGWLYIDGGAGSKNASANWWLFLHASFITED